MADVTAIFILTDVVPKVVVDVIANFGTTFANINMAITSAI